MIPVLLLRDSALKNIDFFVKLCLLIVGGQVSRHQVAGDFLQRRAR
ncbi:hypothetical protein LJC48_07865 [Desulfovibrio sp. OttesenSCG-928-C06]|nr:hypothetical protein [Desulfovibrio sp. OttesenSCG-928-C06]